MNRCVYIVDDDDDIREEMSELLSSHRLTVRAFATGEALLDAAHELEAGCVILDLHLPGKGGLAVQEQLHSHGALHQIIMLTGAGDVPTAVRAIQAGASDYLLKPLSAQALLVGLEAAFARLDDALTSRENQQVAEAAIARLSNREKHVLRGLLRGAPNKIIAHELDLSTRTVEMYRGTLMDKLGVRSLPEAMRLAYNAGFVSLQPQAATVE